MINRQIERRAGNLSAMFVDFKAAFDSVDKKDNEIEAMKERRVNNKEGRVNNKSGIGAKRNKE